MTQVSILDGDCLEYAKNLVKQIEEGNEEGASATLEKLSAIREGHLFQELGKLTRELHDTLSSFQVDSKISSLTTTDIPDAKERLNHVINMTAQAADKTLNAVESAIPISEELNNKIKFKGDWERFRSREMEVDEFREVSRELDEFFSWLEAKAPELNTYLTEIIMAQDFQDLTGQVIRRVITVVQDVEHGLVELLRITGQKINAQQTQPSTGIEASGPALPGLDTEGVVSSQDDVDDLLSSLGF